MSAPPRTPYFLRAMYAWIGDAGMTPQIIVDTGAEGVEVPSGHADEHGRIVLNIGLEAVRDLTLGNEMVSFSARFGGVAHSVYVPIGAIYGVYARESGEGILFNEEAGGRGANGSQADKDARESKDTSKPTLRIVR